LREAEPETEEGPGQEASKRLPLGETTAFADQN